MTQTQQVKIGSYKGIGATAGSMVSVPIGFIPDIVKIYKSGTGKVFVAFPGDSTWSNGTARQIGSTTLKLGIGSGVLIMGPLNVGSTKAHGFVIQGGKIGVNGTVYRYEAFRTTGY